MAGLLGQSPLAGLLAMVQPNAPVMADAADEAMFARNPNGLMAPQRARVNPLRVFDRVLGGQTISGGLDAERARLTAEASAPAMAEQQQRLKDMVAQLPPEIQLAWAANQEETGKALASNAEAWTLGAGGQRGGLVNGQQAVIASAPTYSTVNDTIYANDRGVSTPTAVAAPGYDDQTQRMNAETAREFGTQRTAAPGVQVLDRFGNVVGENTNQTPQQVAAEQKRSDERVKAASSLESINAKVEDTNRAVDTALGQVGGWTAGIGSGLAAIPGTPAADLKSTIDTIEANLSFNALAEMRANSPTGGALGGIAVRELELLGATVASLRQSQSPEQLRRNLATIKTSLTRLKNAQEQAYQQRFSGGESSSGGPQVGTIEDGYRFLGGNPSNPASWERVN